MRDNNRMRSGETLAQFEARGGDLHAPPTIDTRLAEQNNSEPWIDCNERGRPHHWVFETSKGGSTWFKCKRCPVATVSSKLDSDGRRVHPSPFLR